MEGNYAKTAALACGVSETTYYKWMARAVEFMGPEVDEVPETELIYVQFAESLKWAEAHAEVRLLRTAAMGARGWQAAMTVLERKYPTRWGRSEKRMHEHTGGGGKPIAVVFESDKERRENVARILEEAGALAP